MFEAIIQDYDIQTLAVFERGPHRAFFGNIIDETFDDRIVRNCFSVANDAQMPSCSCHSHVDSSLIAEKTDNP